MLGSTSKGTITKPTALRREEILSVYLEVKAWRPLVKPLGRLCTRYGISIVSSFSLQGHTYVLEHVHDRSDSFVRRGAQ